MDNNHRDSYVICDSASPMIAYVPDDGVTNFAIGTVITLEQRGTGVIRVDPAGTATITYYGGVRSAGQYAILQVIKINNDYWNLIGGV